MTVGTGSGGLLNELTLALTGGGDEVLMPWPTFGQYASFAEHSGLDVAHVLHTTADLVADAPADALPRLEIELSRVGAITPVDIRGLERELAEPPSNR